MGDQDRGAGNQTGRSQDEGRRTGQEEAALRLSVRLKQVQEGEPYRLRIPVAVTMEGADKAFQTVVEMQGRERTFEIRTPARPVRIDVDPEFDLFRRLDRDEIPPAITQALGAKKMLVLLPASAEKELLEAYRVFADSLSSAGPDEVAVKLDKDLQKLPSDATVVLLGWENRFLDKMLPAWKDYDVTWHGTGSGSEERRSRRRAMLLC